MEDYLPEKVADVVARVKEALWEFPGPVHRPREEFFAVDNLLGFVQSSGIGTSV